jgi:hypothetical protein
VLDFDPNAPEEKPTTQPEWATYVPYAYGKRPSKFKTHTKMAHACAAVMNANWNYGGVILYRHNGADWQEIMRVDPSDKESRKLRDEDICGRCGGRLDQAEWPSWRTLQWKRERGRIADPPTLEKRCGNCRNN